MNRPSTQRAPAAPRLRERHKEDTRRAILDSAESIFSRQGMQTTRMEDVAAGAGVAVGTLYNYFADRRALFDDLLAARRDELLALLDAAVADREPPFERRLERFLAVLVDHFHEHAGLLAVFMEAELIARAEGRSSGSTLRAVSGRLERVIRDGVKAGVLRAGDADLYPAQLTGTVRSLFIRRIHGIGGPLGPDTAARIVRIFLRGAGTGRRS